MIGLVRWWQVFSLSLEERQPRVKIGDFGLSRLLAPDSSGALATWQWLAPEVLGAMVGDGYGLESDVYSFAICCWEIASRSCTSHLLT